jgi:hypothetical protein
MASSAYKVMAHDIILNKLAHYPEVIDLSQAEWNMLDSEISDVLHAISGKPDPMQASDLLDTLGQIQEILAVLHFRYKLPLSKRQRDIVRDFDRCDDPDARSYVFHNIKNGHYKS